MPNSAGEKEEEEKASMGRTKRHKWVFSRAEDEKVCDICQCWWQWSFSLLQRLIFIYYRFTLLSFPCRAAPERELQQSYLPEVISGWAVASAQ